MDQNQNYITEEKRVALIEELKELKGPKRKEILEALEFAKSLGDLSENAEYHQAREEQGKLEERISKIESVLQSSVVVEKHHSTKVEVGATVTVQKVGTKEKKVYTIVGSEEADLAAGKISHNSSLGMALYGKKKGEIGSFESKQGTVQYEVIALE